MEKAWRLSLYHVPIENNLEILEDTLYNLNVYPVCGF
jgi:hypothetical protein